ncbi:hypothetical protein [Chamaesiphon polymorphus]|uniref:Uncharacterized protein n=1 Tax=Chamaesiphon polymorphus CCALA 037 TaxID=2107692 RepID=A0A2T1GFZ9_9CYAN|nr:hypothetical protein [Chamaesiphon polymorphus]PSB56506.1 hypothetical protein C7B77_11655 [Chamaesiphon polymorphus CCALA 037]
MTSAGKVAKKPDKKVAKKNPSHWLSIGIIALLVGGTISAKHVFLVDEDIEITTKFSGQSWQISSQSLRKAVGDLDRFTHQYLDPIGANIGQQSQQLLIQAGNALSERKDWCIPRPQFSSTSANPKDLNSTDSERSTTEKAKTRSNKLSAQSKKDRVANQPNSDRSSQDWCITTGTKK